MDIGTKIVPRKDEQNKIREYLRIVEGRTAANLLIVGPPGTGKTTITQDIFGKWNTQIRKSYLHLNPTFASASPKPIFEMFVDDLRPRQKVGSLQDMIRILKDEIERIPTLVVLDDIASKHTNFLLNTYTLNPLNAYYQKCYLDFCLDFYPKKHEFPIQKEPEIWGDPEQNIKTLCLKVQYTDKVAVYHVKEAYKMIKTQQKQKKVLT